MHVLQVLPRLSVGGVERGVLDLARGLIRRGHQVSVVSAGGELVEPLVQSGASHYHLPVDQKSLRTIASCAPALAELIRAKGVDLVHARSRVPAWSAWLASRRTLRPFVTTAHGFYRPHPASRVMMWGQLVIAPSQALGRYLLETFRLPRERLRVVPRGVDLDEFALQPPTMPHDGPWRVGVIGRFSPLKGQATAIQAAALLARRGVPATLVLAGGTAGDRWQRELESLARRLKVERAIEWVGRREGIPQLIASCDLIAVPSTYPESFGRGVVEAQAVGRPVVASRLGALEELIEDGVSGLLVPPGNAEILADALARLCADADLRARCIAEGRARVEREWHVDRMVERTLDVYQECLERPRVVIWKLSALGDVVLSTPSLRAIRQRYPKSHVALVVGRAAYEVVARCPYLDDLIIHQQHRGLAGVLRAWSLLGRVRRGCFDVSVDLQNSRLTHLLAYLAGIPMRIGYRRRYGWLLSRGVRLPKVVLTPLAHQQHLLRQSGIPPEADVLELWPSAQEQEAAARWIPETYAGDRRPVVGVHPGGSGRWRTKRWPLERWAALCDALAQRGVHVVVTGGPDERGLAASLVERMASQPTVAVGQTSFMELACLIGRCDAFMAHDSAPLHLAAAMGTPTVALFGPTDPGRHLPPAFRGAVIQKDVFCSPCYATRCRTITHACMRRITLDEVLAAVLALLERREKPLTTGPLGR